MEKKDLIIKGLRKQLASWENIFFNIKINSKGKWADATYYQLLEKERFDLIKEEIKFLKELSEMRVIRNDSSLRKIEQRIKVLGGLNTT